MSARRVAVDLGANSGRVAVGWLSEGGLEFEIVHRFPNGPVETPDGLKWDFDRLLSEIEVGLIQAGEAGDVASIGVDSWAVDYGIVDSEGKVICSPFHYRDARTNGIMEAQMAERGEEIFQETGLQFLPFNTLYQLLSHQSADPSLFNKGNQLLMVPDLVHAHLGGKPGIERTNASTTQFYNPKTCTWSDPLRRLLPEVQSMLPPITDPGTELGNLRPDLALKPGLAKAKIITPATHDTGSAVLAVPFTDPDTSAYIISGTWSLVGLELPAPLINKQVKEENFSNEVGAFGTIRFLKNMMGLWIFQECLRAWGLDDLDALVQEAERHVQGIPTFDPDDRAFLEPGLDMPNRVRNATPGLANQPAVISAAIFASLAKKTAQIAKQAADLAGKSLKTLQIVGGGSQNRLLNQLIADASGLPVVSGPVEATLIGNLLVQFESAGELTVSIRDTVRQGTQLETFQPRP